ncbi:MAG: hypothetical protein OXH54_16215 [Acidimicrobiaceae bacterium]|nr:hypothetical protein [Acidimicrobiaceae bacterium]
MKQAREEIAMQADQFADRFEDFDPAEATEVPVAEYLLARAARESDRSERELTAAVTAALESGTSWARIGRILGTSGREAQMRYRHLGG